MRKLGLTICVIFFFTNSFAQSYGLQFNSHESLPEKRTCLSLGTQDSLVFSGDIRLDFDLHFIPDYKTYFGYVLRIINGPRNIDIVYDQPTANFRVIDGQSFTGISFSIDSSSLFSGWSPISVIIQGSKRKLQLLVNNKVAGTAAILPGGSRYKFLWGANDYSSYQTRDIPPMCIKDIKLFDNDNLKYYWPLNEVAGNASSDNIRKSKAIAKNPFWIKPVHENWALLNSFVVKGNAVPAFDQQSETLIIAASDSVLTYNLKSPQSAWQPYAVTPVDLLPGSQAIYDTITHKLLDVYIDEKKVVFYKLNQPGWSSRFHDSLSTEYGHANKFIAKTDTSLYIIGGYGQLRYKNTVQRYSIPANTWEIVKTKGDFLPPRYLAALGINTGGDTAFIIGGYGSPSGDQMLDPGNYSDMYAFDIKAKSFKKLFSLDTVFSTYAFANSLVIDSKSQQYYGLVFPNDSFNSNLQVVQGSLKKPGVQLLGTKIPYSFYDAQSFADLYYAPSAGKLIAVTIFGPKYDDKVKYSTVKIYTLGFPPDAGIDAAAGNGPGKWKYIVIALSGLAAIAIAFFVIKRKRQAGIYTPAVASAGTVNPVLIDGNESNLQVPDEELPFNAEAHHAETAKMHSAVSLFGQFQVFDKDGNDITDLFTPLIKELFLLIVIYTFKNNRGITSEELNDVLWSGKPVKDAKNNRSVNMTKLKNIIEKIGDCSLVKKSNFWQFHSVDNAVAIDYETFVQLAGNKDEIDKDYMKQVLQITGKGAFLLQTEYEWLDDIKAEVSNTIIDISLQYLSRTKNVYDDPEFVIDIANCIFYFDRLNEDALEYKCKSLIYLKRHALANKTYTKFQKDYKDMYGEEFGRSFMDVVKAIPSDT